MLDRNVQREYCAGVIRGSIFSVFLSRSGVVVEKREGRVEWMRVAGRMLVGAVQEESSRRQGITPRDVLAVVVGVSISRVRTISSGARTVPATAAAATAIDSEARGEGESMISSPPTPGVPDVRPGSGIFSKAASMLRIQVSIVRRRRVWRNVTFVPFQVPHEPSRVQSWEMTSVREAGLRRRRRWEGWLSLGLSGGIREEDGR